MTDQNELIQSKVEGADVANRQTSATTESTLSKRRSWAAPLVAGIMTLVSMHFLLIHATSGWWDAGEILLAGPVLTGHLLAVCFARMGVSSSDGLLLSCGACVGFLGWYCLAVWCVGRQRPSSRRKKVFWILVAFLTWLPALILAFLAVGGVPMGSSA